jgi:transcriptional regulator with XRE-family HTH domain
MAEPYPVLTALRLLRQARGITQQTVADAIGIGRVTLNRWECGAQDPSLAGTIAYARLLGLRVSFEIEDTAPEGADERNDTR